jgi:hypothetical protein
MVITSNTTSKCWHVYAFKCQVFACLLQFISCEPQFSWKTTRTKLLLSYRYISGNLLNFSFDIARCSHNGYSKTVSLLPAWIWTITDNLQLCHCSTINLSGYRNQDNCHRSHHWKPWYIYHHNGNCLQTFTLTICGLPIKMCNWDQFFKMHDVKFWNSRLHLLAKVSGTQYVTKQAPLWMKWWKCFHRKVCMSMNNSLLV